MLQRDEKREEREGWVRVFNSMELLRKGAGWGGSEGIVTPHPLHLDNFLVGTMAT